ncbi:MAG: BTAD domain-containing putative transcriptional regulator [Anaerolineales bacterium]
MATLLRIYLFQSLQAFYGERLLALKVPPKVIPMWAYMLLHADQPIVRSTLAFRLWPDVSENTALTNLRRHVYHLKSILPPPGDGTPWLLINPQSVQWNPQARWWLDVAEFERLSQGGPAVLEQAVKLYRGDLLADCYNDLILAERERLRNIYLTSLETLASHHRSQGHFTQAIEFTTRLMAMDPLNENTLRLLMSLRYESGDRTGALKEYKTFYHRLQEELEIEPMSETQALADAIHRDHWVWGQGTGKTTTSRPESPLSRRQPPLLLPFVGREAEMAHLRKWWQQTVQGTGGLVMVSGETGIGKTRLMEEFARDVERRGGRILIGHATAIARTPYQPVLNALRRALPLLATLDLPPLWQSVVASLLPELLVRRGSHASPLPKLPLLDPEQERIRLFEGLFRCLSGLSRPRPVMLILEDLQWADVATLELLVFFARRLRSSARILCIGTYREEELLNNHPLAALRRTLHREGLWHLLALDRLSSQAVKQLLSAMTTQAEHETDVLAARLHTMSEGHPLFLQEWLHHLLDKGLLQPDAGYWRVQLTDDLAAPIGIQQIVMERLAHLSPAARTLADIAAVLGPAFPYDLLHRASGWTEYDVLECLDEMLDGHVLREAGLDSLFDYAFSHHLVQSTIYAASATGQRRRRHRRVARLLAEEGGPPAEIARHYDLGGEPELAAQFYLQTAQQALVLRSDDDALAALERGLALAQADDLRWQLLVEQEEILHRRGERTAQEKCLAQLERLAERLMRPDDRCEVIRRYIRYYRVLGDRGREWEAIQALAATGTTPRWQAEARLAEATCLVLTSRYADAEGALQQALPMYRALGDVADMKELSRAGQAACLCLWAEIAVHQSRFPACRAYLQEAEALTRDYGNQSLVIQTQWVASIAAFARQEYAESQALAEQMLSLCREIGNREGEADAHTRLATIAARRFQVSEAREHYHQAAELYDLVGKRQGQAAVYLNAGILTVNLGCYDEGIANFYQAEALFEALDDLRGLAVSAINRSAAAIYQGDWEMAWLAAQRAQELTHTAGMTAAEAAALGNLGEIALHRGALPEAVDYLRRGLALRRQLERGPGESAADLSLLALALLQQNEHAEARQVAEELITLCEATPDTIPYPQQALWAAFQVYRALGNKPRAAELLAKAHTVLVARAAAIPDPESRAAFLNMPFNQEIAQAANETQNGEH